MSKYSSSPQDASRQQHGDPPFDRSNSLADLAARIADAHAQVGSATTSALKHALDAGDILIEAQKAVGRGEWLDWLQKHCEFPQTTASLYVRLAKKRKDIEQIQTSNGVASLTIRGALRLLKPIKPRKTGTEPRRVRTPGKSAPALSSLAWSDTTDEHARTSFVDGVGLQALYQAAPADHQRQFREWLRQQDRSPVVEQPQPETLPFSADLSIPPCLNRSEGAAHA
jgi:hypothetical protein